MWTGGLCICKWSLVYPSKPWSISVQMQLNPAQHTSPIIGATGNLVMPIQQGVSPVMLQIRSRQLLSIAHGIGRRDLQGLPSNRQNIEGHDVHICYVCPCIHSFGRVDWILESRGLLQGQAWSWDKYTCKQWCCKRSLLWPKRLEQFGFLSEAFLSLVKYRYWLESISSKLAEFLNFMEVAVAWPKPNDFLHASCTCSCLWECLWNWSRKA